MISQILDRYLPDLTEIMESMVYVCKYCNAETTNLPLHYSICPESSAVILRKMNDKSLEEEL